MRKSSCFFAILMPVMMAQTTTTAQAPVDFWNAMILTIREVLKSDPEFRGVEEQRPIVIGRRSDVVDLTGDGSSEALIYLGFGGASTDAITLMRIEGRKPVLARFKGKDGKVSSTEFLRGSSVMHSDGITMVPQEHAVFTVHSRCNPEYVSGALMPLAPVVVRHIGGILVTRCLSTTRNSATRLHKMLAVK